MSDTDALTVAKVFEEYRRFGAPSLIRHDRDPRFMSEVFQAFAELIQARSNSTLSYRPQPNGKQEQSVKTVMQSVKVYVGNSLQQEWDEIAERLVFAINKSHDMTRKETPFYLIALEMAREYQAVEKARRARIHNENLSHKEQPRYQKYER
ncbi:reverse transcriptase [Phytophthora megakarya]|uniref:Reverse transcriptase n=1 Tax=Phytophthora megakarya TaxID=4795 RepID=A0A225VNT9_9STRA|nr:reverse transcriptase [Phytophthora megakarya]